MAESPSNCVLPRIEIDLAVNMPFSCHINQSLDFGKGVAGLRHENLLLGTLQEFKKDFLIDPDKLQALIRVHRDHLVGKGPRSNFNDTKPPDLKSRKGGHSDFAP